MAETDDKRYSILIVDDIPRNIQLLGNLLRNEGYILSFTTQARQAIEMVKTDPFDLILLDVMMPEMDGFELCRLIKETDTAENVPIIFLTAKTEGEDIVKGFRAGAVDYVTKPFKAEELLARVRTHIELKTARDDIRRKNEQLRENVERLEELNSQLRVAFDEIKTLRGILPICSNCKRIRLENHDPFQEESWVVLETYLSEHTEANLTHSICPQCLKRLYPDLYPAG